MPIIDAHTLVGAWPQAEVDLSLEALAAGMQSRGIGRSLVTHASAMFYDMVQGNDELVRLCGQHEPLEPVAVLNPLQYPACLEEADRRRSAGVKVFRLCPREHGYPFAGTVGPLRELLRRLEGTRLLLVDLVGLPVPQLGAEMEELLPAPTAFTVESDALGLIFHAAKEGPNVWVETSRLQAGGAIEAAVRHLGAERVIFGSGAPLRSLGAAITTLQFAELPDADRAAIFEGNVQRVLA